MKHSLSITLTALLFLSLGSSAALTQDMRFGAKAGISLFNTTTSFSGGGFSVEATSDRRLGFAAGAYAIIPINDRFSFQPELMFVQKGGKMTDDDFFFEDDDFFEDEGGTSELIFNYLDIPLLVRFDIPVEASAAPYLTAGPVLGILLSGREKFNGESTSIADELKSLNFGLSLGAGLAFNQFHVDLRYEIGLSNILDMEMEDDIDDFMDFDFSVKTSGLLLTVGIAF